MHMPRTNSRIIKALSALAIFGLCGLAAGCGVDDGGDEVAVAESSAALESSADFALVTDIAYSAPLGLGTMGVDAARTRMITAIRNGLDFLIGSAPCITIDSDDMTFVEAQFENCGTGEVPVDGLIRASLDFETRSCLAGECPTAVTYQLDPIDFSSGDNRFAGAFGLRDPVDPNERMSSTGVWTLETEAGGELGLDTNASWLRTGLCVDMSWDATLTLNEEAREAIGTDVEILAARATDIRRCLGQCPSQGTLDIAYGQGEVLRVEYTGGATAQVTGPRGVGFEVDLPCNAPTGDLAGGDQPGAG